MDYFGISQQQLEKAGGDWTAREISQQPQVWPLVRQLIAGDADLRAFLDPLMRRPEMRIILTGAGSSSFVGECAAPALARKSGLRVAAVATTDLVASPESWLLRKVPTLLVSFARSGNSPESVAAVTLAAQCVQECHHLIFTCNVEGALYRLGRTMPNTHVVLLPEETNDRGFAMTSSFSAMLLATALTFDLIAAEAHGLAQLPRWADDVLTGALPLIQSLVREGFERVVYLGSNALKGLAREAALKTLELSDGRVVAISDTPLGFRHGPKTIVNRKTLVVLFLCNDPHTRRYDVDLLNELRSDGVAGRVLALTAQPDQGADRADGIAAHNGEVAAGADQLVLRDAAGASDLALCFPYVVFAQLLAFMYSLTLGLRPDVPNASGIVNRVVQGVSIYPLEPAR
jgi:tagatose-6-phosphate ketose/aldose isomerase